jgi:uncharacterized protein YjbI with pentapeptide repeats
LRRAKGFITIAFINNASGVFMLADATPARSTGLKELLDAANDAAKREATQWFFIVTLMVYLAVAVGSTTHRKLLLEEPIQLPIFNVALPLTGFYVVAPAIFVVLHFYVLAQIRVMVGKVRAAVAAAEAEAARTGEALAVILARVDNFPVAQMMAARALGRGGAAMTAMAWLTLIVAPVLLLLFFQVRFLPYQDPAVTWVHRGLLFLDVVMLLTLWPWPRGVLAVIVLLPLALFLSLAILYFSLVIATIPAESVDSWAESAPAHVQPYTLTRKRDPLLVFWDRITNRDRPPLDPDMPDWTQSQHIQFPREPWPVALRRALFDGEPDAVSQRPTSLFSRVLVLPNETLITEKQVEALAKQTAAGAAAGDGVPEAVARTLVLRGRSLRGAVFTASDLRKADLTGAILVGARLDRAWLQGASLREAQMRRASLIGAQMQRASLVAAQMQGALLVAAQLQGGSLDYAQMQGALLVEAQLQGASFGNAEMQGARLDRAHMQGARLDKARLQGASLDNAQMQDARLDRAQIQGASLEGAWMQGVWLTWPEMQGASLRGAQMQGALLYRAQMQGASLERAQMQGASLDFAQMQGASLDGAQMQGAILDGSRLWRVDAARADIALATLDGISFDSTAPRDFIVVPPPLGVVPMPWQAWVERWVSAVPDGRRDAVRKRLAVLLDEDDTPEQQETQRRFEAVARTPPEPESLLPLLVAFACSEQGAPFVARGIVAQIWLHGSPRSRSLGPLRQDLARALLPPDSTKPACPGARGLTAAETALLREIAEGRR